MIYDLQQELNKANSDLNHLNPNSKVIT